MSLCTRVVVLRRTSLRGKLGAVKMVISESEECDADQM